MSRADIKRMVKTSKSIDALQIRRIGVDYGKPGGDDSVIVIRTGDRMNLTSYKALLKTATARVNKYGAKRTVLEGVTYDSAKEAAYMATLMWREKLGQITNIVYHKVFKLVINGVLICSYEADFVFYEVTIGNEVATHFRTRVVDCKGWKAGAAWNLFQIKRRLMKVCHNIDVEVV